MLKEFLKLLRDYEGDLPLKFTAALMSLIGDILDRYEVKREQYEDLLHDYRLLERNAHVYRQERDDWKQKYNEYVNNAATYRQQERARETDRVYKYLTRDGNKQALNLRAEMQEKAVSNLSFSPYINFIKIVRAYTSAGLASTKDGIDRFLSEVGNKERGASNVWLTSTPDLDALREKLIGN